MACSCRTADRQRGSCRGRRRCRGVQKRKSRRGSARHQQDDQQRKAGARDEQIARAESTEPTENRDEIGKTRTLARVGGFDRSGPDAPSSTPLIASPRSALAGRPLRRSLACRAPRAARTMSRARTARSRIAEPTAARRAAARHRGPPCARPRDDAGAIGRSAVAHVAAASSRNTTSACTRLTDSSARVMSQNGRGRCEVSDMGGSRSTAGGDPDCHRLRRARR